MTYQPHELASIFPRMNAEPFDALVESIRKNGLRVPITLYEGKILDGIHRDEACAKAEVEPRYVEYDGTDPIGFVTDINFARRDLTTNQRAIVGARLANLRHGQRPRVSSPDDSQKDNETKTAVTRKEAAKKVRTSPSSIDRAKAILATNNVALADAVMADQVGLEKAAKIAGLSGKTAQNEALAKAIRTPEQKKKTVKGKEAGKAKVGKSKSKSGAVVSALNSLAWSDAKPAQRTRFIDAIGVKSIWDAMSPAMKDLMREIVGSEPQQAAQVSNIPDDYDGGIPDF